MMDESHIKVQNLTDEAEDRSASASLIQETCLISYADFPGRQSMLSADIRQLQHHIGVRGSYRSDFWGGLQILSCSSCLEYRKTGRRVEKTLGTQQHGEFSCRRCAGTETLGPL